MSRGSNQNTLVTKPDDPANPYSMGWLDSCYQETLLPGAPWHRVDRDLCDALSEFLPKQMSQPDRAAVLAGILGKWELFISGSSSWHRHKLST